MTVFWQNVTLVPKFWRSDNLHLRYKQNKIWSVNFCFDHHLSSQFILTRHALKNYLLAKQVCKYVRREKKQSSFCVAQFLVCCLVNKTKKSCQSMVWDRHTVQDWLAENGTPRCFSLLLWNLTRPCYLTNCHRQTFLNYASYFLVISPFVLKFFHW
jgi:hypothetical protein